MFVNSQLLAESRNVEGGVAQINLRRASLFLNFRCGALEELCDELRLSLRIVATQPFTCRRIGRNQVIFLALLQRVLTS